MSGFEKYRASASVSLWDTYLTVAEQEILFEHAYNAGVLAERERCAAKAWSVGMDIAIAEPNIHKDPREVGSKIAAAIRMGE
jgi:hypothetical protein